MATSRRKHTDNITKLNEIKPSITSPSSKLVLSKLIIVFDDKNGRAKINKPTKKSIEEIFQNRREYRKANNIPLPKPKAFKFSPEEIERYNSRKHITRRIL